MNDDPYGNLLPSSSVLPLPLALLLFLLFFVLGALFAMCESAAETANESRIKKDAESGEPRAKKLLEYLERSAGIISPLQSGMMLMGFGILFTGLMGMTEAVSPLSESQAFTDVLQKFSDVPILGILTGLITTFIVQSSSAVIGMVQALSSTGAFTFQTVYPLIIGINLGTCITTAIVCSIGTDKDAKRTGEDFKKAKEALGDLARSEEDVMSYICYPDQAMKFFEDRKAKEENICTYVIEEA